MAKDPIENLKIIEEGIIAKAMEALNRTNTRVKAKLLQQHLAGGGDTSLAKRTGSLARSITEEPATQEGNLISAKLHAGVVYAKVHFGPRGSAVTITPVKAKMLAIPLAAAKTGAGVARGSPRSGIWGPTKIFRSKAGNLIIWGYQAGKGAGKGELTPLFVLKNSVVIKRRIDPQVDLVQWAKPVLIEEIKKGGLLKVG
jgi:hypothetical protein